MRLLSRGFLKSFRADERGVALVAVIGMGAVLIGLTAVLAARAVTNLRQASTQARSVLALHAADAGIDRLLHELKTSSGTSPSDPALSSFEGEEEEREVVLAAADELVAFDPDRLVSVPLGEWIALRPEDTDGSDLTGTAYSVGYIPNHANPDRIRILRVEYEVSIFDVPRAAILAGGNLRFTSSVDVVGDIHTNGNLYSSSGMDATGTITSSGGTCQGCTSGGAEGSGPNMPAVDVPPVHPRDYYDLGTSGSARWDLCPDGTARLPASSSSPCTGTVVSSSGTFRGWSFDNGSPPYGDEWTYGTSTRYDGIYYVYQANAFIDSVGSTSNPWRATVIAETENSHEFEETTEPADHCPHVGGDIITNSSVVVQAHPEAENVAFVAGRDFFSSSSFDIVGPPSGMLYAHEQIMASSSFHIYGGLTAENACNTPGSTVSSSDAVYMSSEVDLVFDGAGGGGNDANTIRTTIWSQL